MNRPTTTAPRARNWKDIPQQVSPRTLSKEGRKRRVFGGARVIAAAVVLAALAWGGWEVYHAVVQEPAQIASAVQAPPLKSPVLRTDGVLTHAWLVAALDLPKKATLMELDLDRLQQRLLAHGQVRSAVLTRNFPDTLDVTLQERSPVARLNLQIGRAAPRPFLVARDGVIYDGAGYNPALLATLPWLDGVTLAPAPGGGFAPIAGMAAVAGLLQVAQNQTPQLYANWQVVSLARLASDGQLIVRSKQIDRIVFSANGDYLRQLGRLDVIVDTTRAQPDHRLASVDLALGDKVPVAADASAVPVAAGASASASPPPPASSSLFKFNLKSTTSREL